MNIEEIINSRMMGIVNDEELLVLINRFRENAELPPLDEVPIQIQEIVKGVEERQVPPPPGAEF